MRFQLYQTPLPEAINTENIQQTESESPHERTPVPSPHPEPDHNTPIKDDATGTPALTTPNNMTRYNLREAPVPKTYDNLLVHELQAKPDLLKFMQRKPANQ